VPWPAAAGSGGRPRSADGVSPAIGCTFNDVREGDGMASRVAGWASESPPGVLIAGGTGFVGSALARELVRRGIRPRVATRSPQSARTLLGGGVDIISADWVSGKGVGALSERIRVAYYLVHSLGSGPGFADADRQAATRFAEEMERGGVERVVYLGGLGDEATPLSPHLASRREVERILRRGSVPVTTLRAAIILGAGGSSFEMLVQLVEKLPVMICPRWVETRCQPIALTELLRYLVGCADLPQALGETFDVGGPDILTYRTMLERVGDQIGRRPRILVVPVLTPSLSAHWVGFITQVPADLARPLVEGMRNPVVCRDGRITELVPGPRIGFDAALRQALGARRPGVRRFVPAAGR
jgi:uncharacterized protein YbjT (DUF2867 family)